MINIRLSGFGVVSFRTDRRIMCCCASNRSNFYLPCAFFLESVTVSRTVKGNGRKAPENFWLESLHSVASCWVKMRPQEGCCVLVYDARFPLGSVSTFQKNVCLRHQTKLTPWSRVLRDNLTVSQLVKKSHTFNGTRRFIAAFTTARHLSLAWVRSVYLKPIYYFLKIRCTVVFLFTPGSSQVVSIPQVSRQKLCLHLSTSPHSRRAPFISFFLISSSE